jgi:hypothetical protein
MTLNCIDRSRALICRLIQSMRWVKGERHGRKSHIPKTPFAAADASGQATGGVTADAGGPAEEGLRALTRTPGPEVGKELLKNFSAQEFFLRSR